MSAAFPTHVKQALDSYDLPPMSADFTDRLVKKALAQPVVSPVGASPARWKPVNKAGSSPWKRGGYLASGIVGFGLVSAAAAAALSLAEIPVRLPIISDLVERVLPASPALTAPAQPAAPERVRTTSTADDIEAEKQEDVAVPPMVWRDLSREEKRDLVREQVLKREALVQQRRADRGLPPLTQTQLRRRRAALRRAVVNGKIRRPVVRRHIRQTLRERRKSELSKQTGLSGPTKPADIPENIVARPDRVTSLIGQDVDRMPAENALLPSIETAERTNLESSPIVPAAGSAGIELAPMDGDRAVANPAAPAKPAVSGELQDRLPAKIRNRLEQASPAERRRILRDMRNLRKNTAKRRQARQRLRDIRNRTK